MGANGTGDVAVGLGRVLSAIVGGHLPQGDAEADMESAGNLPKLAAIAMWAAEELSCGGRLMSYFGEEYSHESGRVVADGHRAIIMDALDVLPDALLRQYAEMRLGMRSDDDAAQLAPMGTTAIEAVRYEYVCSRCGNMATDRDSYCSECGRPLRR